MAQGPPKKKATKASTSSSHKSGANKTALGPKRGGNRVIAPKKARLRKERAIVKKQSGALTALTEKTLGERAGRLEMLGGKKRGGGEKEGKGGKGPKEKEGGRKEGEKGNGKGSGCGFRTFGRERYLEVGLKEWGHLGRLFKDDEFG